jgi:photosystem II stability/assembly factor-like uncharacterized protein
MNGPYGGVISCLVTGKNGCICAGTDYGGLYVSNDNGNHWTERIGELILCLAVNKDGKLFAGGLEGLYTSTDDGITWTSVNRPDYPDMWIGAIVLDSSNHIYMGGSMGLFRSDDDGESWLKINSGIEHLGAKYPRCLTAGPQGVIFAGFEEGVYRTTDYGAHWSEMNNGLTSLEMRSIVITKSGFVLAATYGRGVFRSTIYGDSWVKVLDDFSFSLAIDNTGHIFHGSIGTIPLGPGVFRSDDEGLTWMPHNTGLGNLEVRSLAVNSEDIVFAGTMGMGVFRSSNQGLSWEETNEGLDNMIIGCLNGNSKNEIFAGCYGGGIQKSSDGGSTWTRIAMGLDPCILTIAIDSSDRIFLSNRGGAFMSTDNGETWNSLLIGIDGPRFAISNDGYIVAAGPGGVWISDSTGVNWVPSLVINYPEVLNDIVINDSNYIFAGAYPTGLYRSKDVGSKWDHIMIENDHQMVNRLFFSKTGSLFASVANSIDWRRKVLRSDDNGASWIECNGLPDGTDRWINSFTTDSSGCIYAGTFGAGVYRSCDDGNSWVPFNNGLKRKDIISVYIDRNGYLYAGSTGGNSLKKSAVEGYTMSTGLKSGLFNESNMSDATTGGYLYKIKIMGGSTNYISIPESKIITLEQNFPNPFSVNSTIRYHLAQPEVVSLKVYNSLGQLVLSPVNERKEAGLHEVVVNGTEMPAGIYFYQLQTQQGSMIKKLIVSK